MKKNKKGLSPAQLRKVKGLLPYGAKLIGAKVDNTHRDKGGRWRGLIEVQYSYSGKHYRTVVPSVIGGTLREGRTVVREKWGV